MVSDSCYFFPSRYLACFVMEGVGVCIVTLVTSDISTSATASIDVSSGGKNFLVVSVLLVSLCSMDRFNGALEVVA